MTTPIIPPEIHFERGAAAFTAGRPRDSHNMNWHSPALADWLAGYDHAERAWCAATRKQAVVVMEVAV